jgi:superfamily II DNA or RNA helicase
MIVTFPPVLAIDEISFRNPIRQIGVRSLQREGALQRFISKKIKGHIFKPSDATEEILIIPSPKQLPNDYKLIVCGNVRVDEGNVDLSVGSWMRHPVFGRRTGTSDHETEIRRTLESWTGAFSFVREDVERGISGLRNPQIGAIHAVLAHWCVKSTPATVVMPTGTGKTEVMLSILVANQCPRLIVIVPTDILRTQLAQKFLSMGLLKVQGCHILSATAEYPIVCSLEHIPRNQKEMEEIFQASQVIVTTSSIAGQCSSDVQEQMARLCQYLFIDEAHHAEAPTWSAFKDKFKDRKVLQFTATPFREDGRRLDGEIVFNYPLKKAQEEGYFKPIQFKQVVEFNPKRSDEMIANKAIEQLKEDSEKGHILMARVENVIRAKKVFEIYKKHSEFNPVQLHSGIKSSRQRKAIRQQIAERTAKIIVCVDMLGEGFDLPELKIAAFHDIRKTLAVSLQLAGRFTRSRPELGNATFIANTADLNVQDELRRLYSRDPDWNVLLPQLSDKMIGEQVSLQEFLKGFSELAKEIPLKSVRPALSTVVYQTACDEWTPQNFREGIPGLNTCEQVHHAVNHERHTLVIVTARRAALPWIEKDSLFTWQWELLVVFWSQSQNLLFINSSSNSGEYGALAKALSGENAQLIRGQEVFRTFAGVNRLSLQNVGLTEQLGKNVRYTGRMGADVAPALTDIQLHRALKSVLAGTGYEEGVRVTVGASRKGRIWSHQRDRVDQVVNWCERIGAKLLDKNIDPDEVLAGTLAAETIMSRPQRMPISVDWPETVYTNPEAMWSIAFGAQEYNLSELSLELVSPSIDGPLRFQVTSETDSAQFDLELTGDTENPNYRFVAVTGSPIQISRSESAWPVTDFFYQEPPVIWFSDGSSLEGNQYVALKGEKPPYDVSKIKTLDWSGIDIKKESQGTTKEQDTIQARVIRELRAGAYDVIFDDDGKGESADIVTIHVVGEAPSPKAIEVEFYHCKYSGGSTPGHRLEDLYEVCGQAQKSIFWMSSSEKRIDLFTHLLRRESRRQELNGTSRFEIGGGEQLQTIREMSQFCPISLRIHIVQPGVKKSEISREQLELLGVTENYLHETYQLDFGVIASD